MDKNIIFLDFDGTLTDEKGAVPSSAIQAIKESQTKGNKVFLCTGRCPAELYDWILDIGFDGYIAAGGAFVKAGKQVIRDLHFEEDQLHAILDTLDEMKIDYIMESNHGLYGSHNALQRLQELLPKHERVLLDTVVFHQDLKTIQNISKLVFLDSGVSLTDIQKRFSNEYQITPSTVPIFGKNSGELSMKNIHKADAIDALLKYMHWSKEITYAYGDGNNDIEMIRYVKTGIAMKNGSAALLEIADDIADIAREDGLYQSFKKHELL